MLLKDFEMVEITLRDGKTRFLDFDYNAFAYVEEKFGDIDKCMDEMSKGKLEAVQVLLYAGLMHNEGHEPVSYKSLGRLWNYKNLQVVVEKLTEALMKAMPEDVEAEYQKAKEQAVREVEEEGETQVGN